MLPDRVRSWIEQAARGRVISATPMLGASSSLLHSIVVESAGEPRSLVLRRFTNEEWVRREPDVAFREASSVRKAFSSGLPAPELVACDPDGSLCGVPATLVTLLPGEVVLQPGNRSEWVDGLACAAAQIHRIDAEELPWKYRRFNNEEVFVVPQWSREPEAWKKVIERVQEPPPSYRECFVHRDYHPSNVLWYGDEVSGVVDWVNGCRGRGYRCGVVQAQPRKSARSRRRGRISGSLCGSSRIRLPVRSVLGFHVGC